MQNVEAYPELSGQIINYALTRLASEFELGHRSMNLAFHNSGHTRNVMNSALAIARALDLSDREQLCVLVGAGLHDIIQDYHEDERDGGAVIRVRHAGTNEVASAHEAVLYMDALDFDFTPMDKAAVATAILATIPGWSAGHGTVCQPLLTSESHPITRAVALADLSAAGVHTDTFLRDGPQLFAEDNIDVTRALARARSEKDISVPVQESYRARYIAWLRTQPTFARGRRDYFNEYDLAGLSSVHKDRLRIMFNMFEHSIRDAETAVQAAKRMPFKQMAQLWMPKAFKS